LQTDQNQKNTFVDSYAWQHYPSYALFFLPGAVSATSLNTNMKQAIVNPIWSPFAELRGITVGTGWLDVGVELSTRTAASWGGRQQQSRQVSALLPTASSAQSQCGSKPSGGTNDLQHFGHSESLFTGLVWSPCYRRSARL
jgi:hypothetical protein